MKSHPYAKLFPLITGSELEELAADIDANGLNESIVTYQGMILDGRNRFEACALIGKKPKFTAFSGKDSEALAYVFSANLKRRHLDASQRAMVAADYANIGLGGNQHAGGSANLPTLSGLIPQEVAASQLSVSPRAVRNAVAVKNTGIEELADAVKAGEVSVSAAAEVAKLPPAKQRAAVAKGPKGVKDAAKKSRAAKKDKPEPVSQPAEPETDKETPEPSEPETTAERLRRESLENCKAISNLCYELDTMAERVATLGERPGCWAVHWQSCRDSIKAARSGLWAGRPNHAVPLLQRHRRKRGK